MNQTEIQERRLFEAAWESAVACGKQQALNEAPAFDNVQLLAAMREALHDARWLRTQLGLIENSPAMTLERIIDRLTAALKPSSDETR